MKVKVTGQYHQGQDHCQKRRSEIKVTKEKVSKRGHNIKVISEKEVRDQDHQSQGQRSRSTFLILSSHGRFDMRVFSYLNSLWSWFSRVSGQPGYPPGTRFSRCPPGSGWSSGSGSRGCLVHVLTYNREGYQVIEKGTSYRKGKGNQVIPQGPGFPGAPLGPGCPAGPGAGVVLFMCLPTIEKGTRL